VQSLGENVRRISHFFLLSSLVVLTACAEDAAEFISRAEDAFDAGQYEQAVGFAQQANNADEEKFQAAVQKVLKKKPFDMAVFEKSLGALVGKSEEARRKAQDFDQKSILDQLGAHSMNGFVYRFDDHFMDARVFPNREAGAQERTDSAGFEFNFDGFDTAPLKSKKSKTIIQNGILKYQHITHDYLESVGNINIDKDQIGEIIFRIKCKKGKLAKLSWSLDFDAVAEVKNTGEIDIDIIPDNRFHTYRINAKNVLRRRMSYGARIQKIFFYPSTIPGDEVEIDYIRFVSKKEKYQEASAGVTYETIAKEMRKAIYVNTPRTLSYDVTLSGKPCKLSFGVGILQADAPVFMNVKVVIQNNPNGLVENETKEIYTARLMDAQSWTDATVDMAEWAGRRVTIQFQLNGTTNNVAFISNPVLYSPPSKKMNIIIVLEDALRADHMSCYGHIRTTTPVKDDWIKNGVQFLHAFSQATKTRPSCPSIMTSLYPTATGVWYFTEMLDDNYLTLAEILRSQGFETASFIQNDNAGPPAGLHQGFSYLLDSGILGNNADGIYGDTLFEWMDAHKDRNYFLYLHLVDPHGIYDPPEPFDQFYTKASPGGKPVNKNTQSFDPAWVENPTVESRNLLYDGEIQYNDYSFNALLQKLSADKLKNDTAIIVIADHGEHMGEHDLWEHRPPGYKQVLHVPLLMVYPARLPKGLKISQPVQMIDVMPTILDMAAVDSKQLMLQGDSLLPLVEQENLSYWNNRIVFSEEVVLKKKHSQKAWCSLFFQNWHFLNSGAIADDLTKQVSDRTLYSEFFTTRIFDYVNDLQEEDSLKYDLADISYLQKMKKMVKECQANNSKVHETLTRGERQEIQYEPEAIKRLKGLGYIQ